jgi:hypothetical protein
MHHLCFSKQNHLTYISFLDSNNKLPSYYFQYHRSRILKIHICAFPHWSAGNDGKYINGSNELLNVTWLVLLITICVTILYNGIWMCCYSPQLYKRHNNIKKNAKLIISVDINDCRLNKIVIYFFFW